MENPQLTPSVTAFLPPTDLEQPLPASHTSKLKLLLLIIVGLLLLGLVGGTGYYLGLQQSTRSVQTPKQADLEAVYTSPSPVIEADSNLMLSINFTGLQISEDIQKAIGLGVDSYLKTKNISRESLRAEERIVTFEVLKTDPEWFLGMGIVEGSKNCTIPSGATECGLPGPTFLLIGHMVNNQWTTAAEYTPEFTQLVKAAPEAIMPADQKKVYLPL